MLEKLAQILSEAVQAGPNVYLRTQPEVLDFTNPEAKCELSILGMGDNGATVTVTKDNVNMLFCILKLAFGKGTKVIAWNWKPLATYLLAKTGKLLLLDAVLIDLKIIEKYAGLDHKAPESLAVAMNRLKSVVQSGAWKEAQATYQGVYLPLITTVVPAMETAGILDTVKGKKVYAHYHVHGQENGRLKADGMFVDNFVPHTMSESDRLKLKPRSHSDIFMYFDFRNMEVAVLQHLAKDEKLKEVLEKDDPYTEIYKMVTGIESDPDAREKSKKMFLPVIYGAGPARLVQRMGIAQATAERIIDRIHGLFPASLQWVESHQKQAKETGSAKDIFGKRRTFDSGEDYLARNFSIQSPASTVCLDKLVQLHHALKPVSDIAYSVHDGYCVYAGKDNWKEVFQKGYAVLTSESGVCPGLRLKVACRAGRNLDSLKPLAKAKGAT
jgi:hypothetical protein